jgi:hypothetical protein
MSSSKICQCYLANHENNSHVYHYRLLSSFPFLWIIYRIWTPGTISGYFVHLEGLNYNLLHLLYLLLIIQKSSPPQPLESFCLVRFENPWNFQQYITKFLEFFIYSGCKSFIGDVVCKYLSLTYGLSSFLFFEKGSSYVA